MWIIAVVFKSIHLERYAAGFPYVIGILPNVGEGNLQQ